MLREGYDGNVNDVSNQPAAKPPAESSSESTESSRFTRGDSTLTTVGRIVMVYAVAQLLMAISALASLSGLDPAASVQVIGGWRIGLRVAWFTLGLVFAGNCVLYLIGGWLGRRAGADTSKSRPFMALMWLSVVTTLIGLLAARATTSGWEAWFSLLIAVILSLYATKVVKRSTRI